METNRVIGSAATAQRRKEMQSFDLTGNIQRYEAGSLEPAEVMQLFQFLIDSGVVWLMTGEYHQTAQILLQQGLCLWPHEIRH